MVLCLCEYIDGIPFMTCMCSFQDSAAKIDILQQSNDFSPMKPAGHEPKVRLKNLYGNIEIEENQDPSSHEASPTTVHKGQENPGKMWDQLVQVSAPHDAMHGTLHEYEGTSGEVWHQLVHKRGGKRRRSIASTSLRICL